MTPAKLPNDTENTRLLHRVSGIALITNCPRYPFTPVNPR